MGAWNLVDFSAGAGWFGAYTDGMGPCVPLMIYIDIGGQAGSRVAICHVDHADRVTNMIDPVLQWLREANAEGNFRIVTVATALSNTFVPQIVAAAHGVATVSYMVGDHAREAFGVRLAHPADLIAPDAHNAGDDVIQDLNASPPADRVRPLTRFIGIAGLFNGLHILGDNDIAGYRDADASSESVAGSPDLHLDRMIDLCEGLQDRVTALENGGDGPGYLFTVGDAYYRPPEAEVALPIPADITAAAPVYTGDAMYISQE